MRVCDGIHRGAHGQKLEVMDEISLDRKTHETPRSIIHLNEQPMIDELFFNVDRKTHGSC